MEHNSYILVFDIGRIEGFFVMKKIVLILVLFIFLFFILALALEFVNENYFGSFEEMKQVEDALGNGTRIIYFGDSVIKSSGNGLDLFMEENLGEKIEVVAHEAYHLGVYEAFANYILTLDKRPEIVVIPINLRSFSPEWDTRPLYQFRSEILKLNTKENLFEGLYVRGHDLFGESGEKIMMDNMKWKQQEVFFGDEKVGLVKDFVYEIKGNEENLTELVKNKFIFQYLYKLNGNERKITSLKNLINKYSANGIKVIVYITPIDYENGEKYVGIEFRKIVEENIEIIKNNIDESKADFIDMGFDLESVNFNYIFVPNEHLKEEGIQYVADKISEKILENKGKNN